MGLCVEEDGADQMDAPGTEGMSSSTEITITGIDILLLESVRRKQEEATKPEKKIILLLLKQT